MTHLDGSLSETAAAARELTPALVEAVRLRGWRVATAESLTGGALAGVLSAAPHASSWFAGGVVAYSPEVKFGLLGVPRGPVVTGPCVEQMARTTTELLGAELCLAVTGVGGPEPEEGEPAGTTWFAVAHPDGVRVVGETFDGNPVRILAAATRRGLELLAEVASHGPDGALGQ